MSGNAGILKKMAAVAAELKYIQKKAKITGPGNPKGVARDDVVAEARPIFLKYGVFACTTQLPGTARFVETTQKSSSGTPLIQFYAEYQTIFSDIEDGSSIAVSHGGQGNDYGDKGPGKASTYAEKLNIIKGLMLETGIEDEGRNPGEGDEDTGSSGGTKAEASSDIKAPQSKSGKAEGKAADKVDPDDAKPASKGLVDQIKAAAKAKGAEDKITATFKEKELSYETLTRGQAKSIWAYLSKLPDSAQAE